MGGSTIAAGPYVLGRADPLDGRPSPVGDARKNRDVLGCFDEGLFRSAPMVASGRILTAQGRASAAFGWHVGELLGADVDADGADFSRGVRNP